MIKEIGRESVVFGESGWMGKRCENIFFVITFVKIAENELFCRILLTSSFHSNCGQSRGKMS